jgi:hypothetical protein
MNKKVIRVMLALVLIFLIGLYVVKIFFPEQFVMTVSNENIKIIGDYIDSHTWLLYLCSGITTFITYSLYCCASTGTKILKWYEYLEIIAVIVAVRAISLFDNNIATAVQFASFIFLPALMHGNVKYMAVTATVHYLAQTLSLSIRNLPMFLTTTNFVTILLMTIECYFWLLLNYLLFSFEFKNKKSKEKEKVKIG